MMMMTRIWQGRESFNGQLLYSLEGGRDGGEGKVCREERKWRRDSY